MGRRRKKVAGETEVDPRRLLATFIEAADVLASTPVLRNADTFSGMRVSWHQGGPTQWSVTKPTSEQMELLKSRLRPFLLTNDWTNIGRMYGLLTEKVRSDELRGYVIESRRTWKRQQKHDGFRLNVDGRDITPEHAARLFLYGGPQPFHYDLRRQDELRGLGFEGGLLTEQKYLNYVLNAIQHVLYVARVAREVLRFDLSDE